MLIETSTVKAHPGGLLAFICSSSFPIFPLRAAGILHARTKVCKSALTNSETALVTFCLFAPSGVCPAHPRRVRRLSWMTGQFWMREQSVDNLGTDCASTLLQGQFGHNDSRWWSLFNSNAGAFARAPVFIFAKAPALL